MNSLANYVYKVTIVCIVLPATCAVCYMRSNFKHDCVSPFTCVLMQIMSKLKQKQRRANDFLAEAMAHNAKMKYLLNPKNQEKISFFGSLAGICHLNWLNPF